MRSYNEVDRFDVIWNPATRSYRAQSGSGGVASGGSERLRAASVASFTTQSHAGIEIGIAPLTRRISARPLPMPRSTSIRILRPAICLATGASS